MKQRVPKLTKRQVLEALRKAAPGANELGRELRKLFLVRSNLVLR